MSNCRLRSNKLGGWYRKLNVQLIKSVPISIFYTPTILADQRT